MTPVVWLRSALNNVKAIHAYYVGEGAVSQAQQITRLIEKTVNQLKEFPALGRPGRVKGTRELLVMQTPYIVIYRELVCRTKSAKSARSEVQILRVLHGSQKWPFSD